MPRQLPPPYNSAAQINLHLYDVSLFVIQRYKETYYEIFESFLSQFHLISLSPLIFLFQENMFKIPFSCTIMYCNP